MEYRWSTVKNSELSYSTYFICTPEYWSLPFSPLSTSPYFKGEKADFCTSCYFSVLLRTFWYFFVLFRYFFVLFSTSSYFFELLYFGSRKSCFLLLARVTMFALVYEMKSIVYSEFS